MFVDADDKLNKKIIEFLVAQVKPKIDIVACSCYGFDDEGQKNSTFFDSSRLFSEDKNDLYLQLFNDSYGQTANVFTAIGVPWGKIYRKDFIKSKGLRFDPKLLRSEDNMFNLYAFNYARDIFYLDKPLYLYRLDHIRNYDKRNLSKIKAIFLPVARARYESIQKLNLYDNKKVYSKYLV